MPVLRLYASVLRPLCAAAPRPVIVTERCVPLSPHTYAPSPCTSHCHPPSHPLTAAAVKLWDGVKGVFVATFRGHVAPVYQVAWSADSRLFVSGSKDSTLKVWCV